MPVDMEDPAVNADYRIVDKWRIDFDEPTGDPSTRGPSPGVRTMCLLESHGPRCDHLPHPGAGDPSPFPRMRLWKPVRALRTGVRVLDTHRFATGLVAGQWMMLAAWRVRGWL